MAATTAIITAVASTGAAIMDTVSNVQQQRAAEKLANTNAKIAEGEAAAARMEYAQNASIYRSNARRQTASAEAGMTAAGNIGSSAEATALDSVYNLSKDLSALRYNHDSRAVSALNQAENYRYNAEVARMNKTSAIIGGSLNTVAAAGQSLTSAYSAGLLGGNLPKYETRPGKVTGYRGAVSNSGMYGAWGGK
jgi:hypothetical protein